MSDDVLAETPERAATGDIAAIYADLRAALGVPMVNLVFRHMATVSGCLPWAWDCLAPLYRGGAIHEAGARMVLLARPRSIKAAGGTGIRADVVAATMTAYIRANPINMIGLSVLKRLLEARAAAADTMPPGPPARVTPITQILPMADLATVPALAVDKLRQLATLLHGQAGPVVPSLFRHFAAWPAALDAIEDVLHDLMAGDDLEHTGRDMEAYGNRVADRLAAQMPHDPDEATAAAIRKLVTLFPPNMTKMTVVAIAIRGAFV